MDSGSACEECFAAARVGWLGGVWRGVSNGRKAVAR